MADTQTSTETPKTETKPLPEKIQLEELEQLRLAAANERLRRMVSEIQMCQMKQAQLQAELQQHRANTEEAGRAQEAILNALGEKYGVGPAIRRYDIDIATGECTLRKQAPQPPKG